MRLQLNNPSFTGVIGILARDTDVRQRKLDETSKKLEEQNIKKEVILDNWNGAVYVATGQHLELTKRVSSGDDKINLVKQEITSIV